METWRHGDMETYGHGDIWTWRHGDMAIWIHGERHEHRDIDMETGHGNMNMEK
jgi:hypothetical protein